MELGLKDRVAVIAGASKGIGRATAVQLAGEGVKVACSARSLDVLREIEKEITAFGGTCLPVQCDLAERPAAAEFVAEAVRAFGKIDIMVFTPSLHLNREFMDLTDDEWEETFDITFHAGVRMARAVIPHMQRQRWGRIVFVGAGSVYKQTVGPGIGRTDVHPDFTTAKAALTNLSKFLSKCYGPDQIFVNTLHPAFVFPPERAMAFAQSGADEGLTPEEAFVKATSVYGYIPALARPGTSEDFAKAIAFFCSEANGYMTGVEAALDGGGLDIG